MLESCVIEACLNASAIRRAPTELASVSSIPGLGWWVRDGGVDGKGEMNTIRR